MCTLNLHFYINLLNKYYIFSKAQTINFKSRDIKSGLSIKVMQLV